MRNVSNPARLYNNAVVPQNLTWFTSPFFHLRGWNEVCGYRTSYVPSCLASVQYTDITIYRETFKGENFHEFRGFVAIFESFLCKIWECDLIDAAQASNLWKFSPRKSYFSPIRTSFLPRKFPAIWYLSGMRSVAMCLASVQYTNIITQMFAYITRIV